MYSLEFHPEWDKYFTDLDNEIQKRIWKKIRQIEEGLPGRHLEHGIPIFVEEVGQHRICYAQDETSKTRIIYFAGKHKDYDKWRERLKQ